MQRGRASTARATVAGILALLACVLAASAGAAVPATPGRTVQSVDTLEVKVLREINALRTRHGLKPLRLSSHLASAADSHSRSMVDTGLFQHTSADGSPFWKRVERWYGPRGYSYWAVGENLLWSSPGLDARRALSMWLASPPHRKNLLAPKWREIGLSAIHASSAPGTFRGYEVTVLTANFGIRR